MAATQWTARPGAREVRRLRHAIADYAASHGVAPRVVDDVALAVSEVVSNCVLHAYPDGDEGRGTIRVSACVDGSEMEVAVVDDGIGLRPRDDSPGAGLGLIIAEQVARRMVVERPRCGGTEVRMTFHAAA